MNKEIWQTAGGLFGPISVGRDLSANTCWMRIQNEIEGQVFLNDEGQPSAIAASPYFYGFVIPAWHFSTSHGLMLGLGAGIGATLLLTLFPALSLTVVEIDPQVIDLSRRYFPLVSFYENQGRLRIIQQDAREYLSRENQAFSFALLDIFCGNEDDCLNLALLPQVLRVTPHVMANMIVSEVSQPATPNDFFWVRTNPVHSFNKNNWMLTNLTNISPDIVDFSLFSCPISQQNRSITLANQYFQFILSQLNARFFY